MGQEQKGKHRKDKLKYLAWTETREANRIATEGTNTGGLKSKGRVRNLEKIYD